MFRLATMSLTLLATGCTVTRPDQENFVFDGQRVPVQQLVDRVEEKFDSKARKMMFRSPDDKPMVRYEVRSNIASATILSLGDDRCDPNAGPHFTFNDQQYAVFLVFRTSDPADRRKATETLLKAASEAGQPLARLTDC